MITTKEMMICVVKIHVNELKVSSFLHKKKVKSENNLL